MRSLRASTWRWLGAVALGGGLLAGGVWYAANHNLTSGVLAAVPKGAFAQEATPPASPAPVNPPPAQTNSARPTGQVVQITANPASFTIQTADGAQMTFRVLDTTVFMAGRDRPYHFDLLKQGDTVVVRGGQTQAAQATASPGPAGATSARSRPARAAAANGGLVARVVMVRPAGEKVNRQPGQAANRPNGGQNGGRNGAGQ